MKTNNINQIYLKLLKTIEDEGDFIETRGAKTKSLFGYTTKVNFPIVTIRKTAWKTALRELEWFMSGERVCPEGVLRDVWWKGQLAPGNELRHGYADQLRSSPCCDCSSFDQVAWLREEIKKHPSSRRLILTTWNPGTMSYFTELNQNPMSPTPCHIVMNQFQVRDGLLHMNAVFRSTDAVLGLPHNFVQHRALQLYFAHHAGVPAAAYYTLFLNDVHIYDHPDHNDFVAWLSCGDPRIDFGYCLPHDNNKLIYNPTDLEFKAGDFSLQSDLPPPLYTKKIERTL